MDSATRLTAALSLFLDCRARGDDPRTLIAAHPDLADLLAPMCEEEEPAPSNGRAFGDFDLEREIGRGGMGVVYEARQRSLHRRVALKILAGDVATGPTHIARFHREARTLARLDHPHIVRVLDVGDTDGRHWLAMELIDGTSLERRLAELQAAGGHSGASRRALVQVMAEIAGALQHVHDAGILHRDVKPSNVLLDRSGRARLSDFGLARDSSAPTLTQVGVVAGTPHYMSPEHLVGGDALAPASDVFSLGATLYECVVLRRAFPGGTTEQVLRDILARDPIDPRRLDKTVHADLAAIILKALEKELGRRYPTARAMADDLNAYLELRPVVARPPSHIVRLRRWARREPTKAVLAAVLLALGVLIATLLVQLPALRRAELARREQAYEDAITEGDLARCSNEREPTLAAFLRARALFPERTEAIAWHCYSLSQFESTAAALDELDRSCPPAASDEVVLGLRAFLLRALGRDEEAATLETRLGAPTTPAGMLFTATTLVRRNRPGDLHRANQLMSLAVRMSKQPRLLFYACWAGVAPPEQQEECANAILALWPDHPIALQQAAVCFVQRDPARATELMRRAIASGTTTGNPNQLLAAMAWRAGDRDTAVAATQAALARENLDDDLRTRLIDRLLREGHADLAATEISTWLERDPANAAALLLHARTLRARGEFAPALEHVERALASRPDDPELACERVDLLAQSGATGEALVAAKAAVGAHPAHTRAHQILAVLCRDQGDRESMLAELRRWVAVRGQEPGGWLALATALMTDPAPAAQEEALAAITSADYLTGGQDRAVLEARARIHDTLGETIAARQARARAAALPPAKK